VTKLGTGDEIRAFDGTFKENHIHFIYRTGRYISGLIAGDGDVNPQHAEKAKAAQMKMFGRLTRETAEWVPARLLCVRFNVKNPFADDKEAAAGSKKKKAPSFDAAELFSKLDDEQPPSRRGTTAAAGATSTTAKSDGDGVQAVAMEVQEEEEQAPEKPPMDLFKAIFADSDSESSSEENNDEVAMAAAATATNRQEKESEKEGAAAAAAVNKPPERSEAPRGIFANIDFDALNRRRPPRPKSPPPLVKEKVAASKPKGVLDQSVRTLLGIKNPR
jgi:G patch domain-containing protein 1